MVLMKIRLNLRLKDLADMFSIHVRRVSGILKTNIGTKVVFYREMAFKINLCETFAYCVLEDLSQMYSYHRLHRKSSLISHQTCLLEV